MPANNVSALKLSCFYRWHVDMHTHWLLQMKDLFTLGVQTHTGSWVLATKATRLCPPSSMWTRKGKIQSAASNPTDLTVDMVEIISLSSHLIFCAF